MPETDTGYEDFDDGSNTTSERYGNDTPDWMAMYESRSVSVFFSIKFKNNYNSTVPIIAEKDTRSSSFHYEWRLQYKLVLINKKNANTIRECASSYYRRVIG